jgi:hypothetical protein
MNIGEAIDEMKHGRKVVRSGWNGRNMFIFFVPGSNFEVNRPPLLGIYPPGTRVKYLDHVDMRVANGSIVPWHCSQSDLLAEDWEVVK